MEGWGRMRAEGGWMAEVSKDGSRTEGRWRAEGGWRAEG
jgi:hypothetical protein